MLNKRWAGHVTCMGEKSRAYRVLVGTSEGRMSLGRPVHKRDDNIKIDLRKTGWGVDWIYLAQDREE
jgi:hypothetical protein